MSALLAMVWTNTDLVSITVKDFGVFSRVADLAKDGGFAGVRSSDDEHAKRSKLGSDIYLGPTSRSGRLGWF